MENLYKLNPAVLESRVNFLKKEIDITFDHKQLQLKELVELLSSLGYEPKITLNQLEQGEQIKTNKKDIEIPLEEIYPIINESCAYCDDFTAEFSDLSVGGARTNRGWEYDCGWNQIIVRTKKGEELLKLAKERKVLEFKDVEAQNLSKLKKAHLNKRKNAVRNIDRKK